MNEIRSILLVEDNPNDVELILAALAEHKLANHVVAVSDGAEALDYLFQRGTFAGRSTGNPALVLLDLKMPRVDGIEVLGIMKKDESLRLIPVVMLTSSREQPDLQRTYELGVNAYVVKPIDFQSFVEVVGHIGEFWALHNQPPPNSANRLANASEP